MIAGALRFKSFQDRLFSFSYFWAVENVRVNSLVVAGKVGAKSSSKLARTPWRFYRWASLFFAKAVWLAQSVFLSSPLTIGESSKLFDFPVKRPWADVEPISSGSNGQTARDIGFKFVKQIDEILI